MVANRVAPSWPRVTLLALALVPPLALLALTAGLALDSRLAIHELGLRQLLGTRFSGIYTGGRGVYGLVPALWGTLLAVGVALGLAVPTALSVAILVSDFSLGIVSRALEAVLGAVGGVPPIVYAIMSVTFARIFIVPKFCAPTIAPEQLHRVAGLPRWSPGMLPTEQSTLLGGALLALFLVPFIAPLMADALRAVPHELREASLALGANRWHTLRHVALPYALPGIVAAATLGALKAFGEAIIVGWAIGFESQLPHPLWDVLERVATLAATGAGMAGGYTEGNQGKPLPNSVASFAGLLLMLVAFAGLALTGALQRHLQQRLTHGNR